MSEYFPKPSSAKNIDLANIKSEVDKLGIYKLKRLLIILNSSKSKVDKLDDVN